jgi:hypothetical protein
MQQLRRSKRMLHVELSGAAAAAELLVDFVHQRMEIAPAAVRWQEVNKLNTECCI